MRIKTLLVVLAAAASPAPAQTVTMQPADLAALPGSHREIYARVQGLANLDLKWTATGGCTLASSATNSTPQTVTAPGRGGACSVQTAHSDNESPSFRSPVSCRITATSAADSSKSASIVLPVCAAGVFLSTFPNSTVLYMNQPGVIQSDLRGDVNTTVRWSLTINPGGAGALLGGPDNRHAIFAAAAPGTYVLTATSMADSRRRASSTIYVTSHPLPEPNADHTESVDCTATGTGKTYEVGPARAIHDLNGVPWNSLKGGDTVRIHNDDTTGRSPTTYHQHIAIAASGSAGKPLRICGVPDEHGAKPVIDGEHATSPGGLDWANGWLESGGLFVLYDGFHKFDGDFDGNQNILIEGLHLRHVGRGHQWVRRDGRVITYNKSASCIHVQTGRGVMIRGNELESCSQGVFANSQTPTGSIVQDLTVEGNYIHDWGDRGNYLVHGMYLQAIGLQAQFNYFGASAPEAIGNLIKSRSVLQFLRWNYMGEPVASNARAFDLVEPQDFDCYIIPHSFAIYRNNRGSCNTPHGGPGSDPYTADRVAANFEAYHSDYLYGNIIDDGGSESTFVHYGYDQETDEGPAYNRRGGTLFYWNNTNLFRKTTGLKVIFDPLAPDSGPSYEFPSIVSVNNVFAAEGSSSFQWLKPLWARVAVDSNWIKPGYELPNREGDFSYQGGSSGEVGSICGLLRLCRTGQGHMTWARGAMTGTAAATLYTGAAPFDVQSFAPAAALHGLGAPLPAGIRDQPSNMQYAPGSNRISFRKDQAHLGALD